MNWIGTVYQILFQNSTDPFNVAGPGVLNVSTGGMSLYITP